MILIVSWWVVLLAGLIPSGWFLLRYWPSQWRAAPALIIRGLVGVVFLAYLRPVVSLAVVGWVPVFRGGWFLITWSYVLGTATDLILIMLLRLFLRYRRAYAAEMDKQP